MTDLRVLVETSDLSTEAGRRLLDHLYDPDIHNAALLAARFLEIEVQARAPLEARLAAVEAALRAVLPETINVDIPQPHGSVVQGRWRARAIAARWDAARAALTPSDETKG